MRYRSDAPLGLVLASGKARRMGGGDKPLLPFRRGTLLSAVMARVGPQCGSVVINAPDDGERWRSFGCRLVPDMVPGSIGPLAGILAGLDHLRAGGEEGWLLSVPGDTPLLPHDLVQRLDAALRSGDVPIACAASRGRRHPVVALWSTRLGPALAEAVAERGLRGVAAFQAEMGCAEADWGEGGVDPFFNVNKPADLAEADRLAGPETH